MSHQKFVRDVGLIGITQALTHLGSFLLLPIITKTLGTYDYGIWAQINVTISLLTPVAVLGLSSGLIRFLSSEKEEKVIQEGFYSIFTVVFFTGLLISVMLYISSNFIAVFAFGDPNTSLYIKIAAFLVFLSAIDQISLFYFRVSRRINAFSYFTIFQNVGKLILAWILLEQGFGLYGVIVAFLIIHFIVFIIAFSKIISHIGFIIPNFTYIKEYLNYSLPLTPNSIIRWVINSSDRYLVTYFLGLGSVGIYSASYSIGWLIQALISPIQLILFPELSKFYDEGKNDQVMIYLSCSVRYFLMLAIPAVFGLAALAQPLLRILTTEEFVSGWVVIPIIALSGVFAGLVQIVSNIIHLVKKTKINLYLNFFAAIINFTLNLILLPIIGFVGAAVSTLISYSFILVISTYIGFKYIKFELNSRYLMKMIISAFVMYLAITYMMRMNTVIDLLLSVILGVVIYLFMLIILKGFTNTEIKWIKNIKNN